MNATRMTLAALVALTCVGVSAAPTPEVFSANQPEALPTLHEHMEGMHDTLRTIGKGYTDETKRDEVLAAIQQLQEHTLDAKVLMPHKIEEMPEDKRADAISDYRVRMAMVLGMTTELEVAFLDGEHEKVDDIIRNKLFPIRDMGHDLFQ